MLYFRQDGKSGVDNLFKFGGDKDNRNPQNLPPLQSLFYFIVSWIVHQILAIFHIPTFNLHHNHPEGSNHNLTLLPDRLPPDEQLITLCTAKIAYLGLDILMMFFCVNQFVKYSNRSLRLDIVYTLLSIIVFTPAIYLKDYQDIELHSFGYGLLGVIILCIGEGDGLMVGTLCGILLCIHTEFICVIGVLAIMLLRWQSSSENRGREKTLLGLKFTTKGLIEVAKMFGCMALAIVGISIPWIENQGIIKGLLNFEHGLSGFFNKGFFELTI